MAEKKTKKQAAEKTQPTAKYIVGTRGRVFEGVVVKKFPKRIVISQERTVRVKKYERFRKTNSKIHARLPESLDVNLGDRVRVQECRPLSKIIHHIVIEKVDATEEKK